MRKRRSAQAILKHPAVRNDLRQAWYDSKPGSVGSNEEGGFIVETEAGDLRVERWPKGHQARIVVPPHEDCQFNGEKIVASFHTHPNTGPDFLQEASESDRRAVRDDPDLKGRGYIGEFIITQTLILLITPKASVRKVGNTMTSLLEA